MYVGTGGSTIRSPEDKRPLIELYRDSLNRAIRADELGFDFFWIGEHHFMENQWNPSPLVQLASFATRTSRIRLGTAVLLTPFYNPIRLAEDLAVLDLISEGRMDLTAGSASRTREFETFGVEPTERFGRMWETLDILRRALSGETFDHKGKYFTIPNLDLTTQPIQKPFPLWFGGFGAKSLRRAGREGYHAQASLGDGEEEYYKGLAEGGHNPDDFNFAIRSGSISLVSTPAEAAEIQARLDRAVAAHNAEYNEVGRDLAFQFRNPTREAEAKNDPADAARLPIAGTPDQILTKLEPVLKNSRVTHLQLRTVGNNWMDLFAKECLPVMQKWGRQPITPAVSV